MGKLWVCDDEPSTRFPVFTRGNIGEVFGRPVSPLTWTTLGVWALERGWREGYCQMGLFTADEFKPLGQAEILACFGGYLYINMSVLRVLAIRIPGMTDEAIDRSAFGDYSDVPAYRPDAADLYGRAGPLLRRPARSRDRRATPPLINRHCVSNSDTGHLLINRGTLP